jgi:hypothetical protein
MRAALRMIAMLFALPIPLAQAWTEPQIADLPSPVRAYAEALKPYCEVIGKHQVVVNRIYSDSFFGELDINRDGQRDYIIYKCMFGCDGEPYALQGLGPNCMFGSLLLSSTAGYKTVPVPGQLSNLEMAPRLRVAVYRERIEKLDCGGDWYCNYVFELRDEWFRLVDVCPQTGCRAIFSALHLEDERQAAAAEGRDD